MVKNGTKQWAYESCKRSRTRPFFVDVFYFHNGTVAAQKIGIFVLFIEIFVKYSESVVLLSPKSTDTGRASLKLYTFTVSGCRVIRLAFGKKGAVKRIGYAFYTEIL